MKQEAPSQVNFSQPPQPAKITSPKKEKDSKTQVGLVLLGFFILSIIIFGFLFGSASRKIDSTQTAQAIIAAEATEIEAIFSRATKAAEPSATPEILNTPTTMRDYCISIVPWMKNINRIQGSDESFYTVNFHKVTDTCIVEFAPGLELNFTMYSLDDPYSVSSVHLYGNYNGDTIRAQNIYALTRALLMTADASLSVEAAQEIIRGWLIPEAAGSMDIIYKQNGVNIFHSRGEDTFTMSVMEADKLLIQ